MKNVLFFVFLPCALAQRQSIVLVAPPPPAVTSVSAQASASGLGTYCEWVIAIYPIGKSATSSPACVSNAGGSVAVNWSPGGVGVTGYDVLRTTSPFLPSGAALLAVATSVPCCSQTDNLGALSSYTLTSTLPAQANLRLDNQANPKPMIYVDTPLNFPGQLTTIGSCTGVDDTALVQSAMDATGSVQMPVGTCVVTNLIPTRDVQLRANGQGSILSMKAGATGWLIDGSTFGVRLDGGIVLDGGLTSTQAATTVAGTRSGVLFNATVRNSGIFGAVVRGFSNMGIGLKGGQLLRDAVPSISGTNVHWNYIGIDTRAGAIGTEGEYTSIIGNSITENRQGLNLHSGNIKVIGNTITDNGYNVQILPGTNNGHGTLTGNIINHATVMGLVVNSSTQGFLIIANDFYFGDWLIQDTSGLVIIANTINATNITLQGFNYQDVLRNNWMAAIPNFTGSSPGFVVADNWMLDATWLLNKRSPDSTLTTTPTGSELVTNGAFASGASWTTGASWSIAGGQASSDGTSSFGLLSQPLAGITVPGTYLITYTISSYVSGGWSFQLVSGGNHGPTFALGNGTYTATFTIPTIGDKTLYVLSANGNFAISNISVKLAVNASSFAADNLQFVTGATGAGSAALGANSPAVTNTAPYTWIRVTTADGSTAFIPAWK
jgi:hypothetical protein